MIELNYMQMLENARNDKNLFNLIHNRFVSVPDDVVLDLENTEYFKNKGGDFKNYYMSTFGRIYGPKGILEATDVTIPNYSFTERRKIRLTKCDSKKSKIQHDINKWILNTWNTVSTEYVLNDWLITNTSKNENRKLINLTYITTGERSNKAKDTTLANKEKKSKQDKISEATPRESGKRILMIDRKTDKILNTFENLDLAAAHIQNIEEYKNDDYRNIKGEIGNVCNVNHHSKSSRGFKWKYNTDYFDSIEWTTIDPKHLNNYKGKIKYVASHCGKVANLSHKKIIHGRINHDGYVYCKIGSDNKAYIKSHLIALTFIPNDDPNKIQVNHKNGNKLDNSVENLEWISCRDNINHAVGTGLKPKTCKKVELFNRNTGETIKTYVTKAAAARDNDIDAKSVTNSINNNRSVISKKTGLEYSFREPTNT